jgi:hypothetical protein
MRTFLFDDKGDTWEANSSRLAEELHASLRGEELVKYVVRNLGFVAVSENGSSVRLRLRPAVVSQMALSALLYWMHDRTIDRALVSLLDGEWTHELVGSPEEAARLLLARSRYVPADREGDFLHKPRPLHDLPRTSPLRAVLDAWSECEGVYDRDRLHPLLQQVLNGRFVLFEAQSGSPSVYVKDVGQGLGQSGGYWLSRTKGLRVEDQPDHAYGKWVAEAYREVLKTGEPALDDVDAVITWPRQPRISYRYRRLVLPFAEAESTLVLSATVIDPDISLRIKPG